MTWTLTGCVWYVEHMDRFLTVAEAVTFTGKSRRTITRLANRLHQEGSAQVMREKTVRGYIWRISQQGLQAAFGVSERETLLSLEHESPPLPFVQAEPEHALAIARQGYAGMMTMHQEVTQTYEALLAEKDQRIVALSQELVRARRGVWGWLLGR